jgi:predicted nucleic acid-binding protein
VKIICDAAVLIGLASIGKLNLLEELYEIKPLFKQLVEKKFRLSNRIIEEILKKAEE